MLEHMNERVGVITVFNHIKNTVMPARVIWRERTYNITKLGYHHKVKSGRTTLHIFSVCNESMAFKLQFNTESLIWTLEEISDGLAS
jgi:hypothetical protein